MSAIVALVQSGKGWNAVDVQGVGKTGWTGRRDWWTGPSEADSLVDLLDPVGPVSLVDLLSAVGLVRLVLLIQQVLFSWSGWSN